MKLSTAISTLRNQKPKIVIQGQLSENQQQGALQQWENTIQAFADNFAAEDKSFDRELFILSIKSAVDVGILKASGIPLEVLQNYDIKA